MAETDVPAQPARTTAEAFASYPNHNVHQHVGPEGRFTSAEGLFIAIPLEAMRATMEAGRSEPTPELG